ncbi:MAG: hypothetical protein V4550_03130 [Gemmatimonadota bacterium]
MTEQRAIGTSEEGNIDVVRRFSRQWKTAGMYPNRVTDTTTATRDLSEIALADERARF